MTTHLQATLEDLLAQRTRIDTAIAALQELGGQPRPATNGKTPPRTKAHRTSKGGRVRCPDCNQLLKPQGMGPHRRSCKKKKKKGGGVTG